MPLTIIAELGINHQGDFHIFEELIRSAKFNGADMVKVQLYDSVKLFGDDSRKHLEISKDQFEALLGIAEKYDIELTASPFDYERFQWCVEFKLKTVKLAYSVMTKDIELREKIFKFIGESDIKIIATDDAVEYNDIWLLQRTGGYPTTKNSSFDDDFDGISDHTFGISYALYAIANGAWYIEKHFALSKQNYSSTNKTGKGNDNIFSMTPDELMILNTYGREIYNTYRGINK